MEGEMTPAQRFAELNNIHWQKDYTIWPSEDKMDTRGFYPRTHVKGNNPTFQDAKSILEVMKLREDWNNFLINMGRWVGHIHIDLIFNPDKLLEVCIKWCESHPIAHREELEEVHR
jgi:hypothetical protein